MSTRNEYVVVVPTPMGSAFVMERGLSSEYPNAKKWPSLRQAKNVASWHDRAQVYTTSGYEQGAGPVWRAKS